MNTLATAQKWHDLGIATIPIGYKAKRPDYGALKQVGSTINGRAVWQTYQEQLPTKSELKAWFSNNLRNIAIVTGWQNLVILDIDNLPLYGVWRTWASHTRAELLNTYRVQTSRGLHLYYYMNNPPETGLKWPGIDVKAAGGYCLIDPSIHPSGKPYKAFESEILTVDSVESILPAELIQVVPERPQISNPCMGVANNPFVVRDGSMSQTVKRNVSILEFFPDAKSTSHDGRWYAVNCPFHNDRHASGWIDTVKNRFGCQACMNGSMDSIQLYAELNGLKMGDAIKELAS